MRGARSPSTRGDAGQAAVLMVGVLAVTGALVVGLAHMAAVVAAHQQAQVAADAAALAGVSGGSDAARAAAARNGATLMSLQFEGDDLVVGVQVHVGEGPWQRTVTASARATRAP